MAVADFWTPSHSDIFVFTLSPTPLLEKLTRRVSRLSRENLPKLQQRRRRCFSPTRKFYGENFFFTFEEIKISHDPENEKGRRKRFLLLQFSLSFFLFFLFLLWQLRQAYSPLFPEKSAVTNKNETSHFLHERTSEKKTLVEGEKSLNILIRFNATRTAFQDRDPAATAESSPP